MAASTQTEQLLVAYGVATDHVLAALSRQTAPLDPALVAAVLRSSMRVESRLLEMVEDGQALRQAFEEQAGEVPGV